MKTFSKPSNVDSLPAPGQKKAAPPLPSHSSLSFSLSSPPFFRAINLGQACKEKKEEKKSLSSPLFWTAPGTEGEGGDESPSPPSATFGCHRHRTTSEARRHSSQSLPMQVRETDWHSREPLRPPHTLSHPISGGRGQCRRRSGAPLIFSKSLRG